MPRTKRVFPSGEVFHVLNRAVARLRLLEKPEDHAAFMRVVGETWQIVPLPIYAMVALKPVLQLVAPVRDSGFEISARFFMLVQWLLMSHA